MNVPTIAATAIAGIAALAAMGNTGTVCYGPNAGRDLGWHTHTTSRVAGVETRTPPQPREQRGSGRRWVIPGYDTAELERTYSEYVARLAEVSGDAPVPLPEAVARAEGSCDVRFLDKVHQPQAWAIWQTFGPVVCRR